ncbi:MAG: translation initiation factor IF-2 [Deltaproteobacteria bacterium]|nr:translation initiation factor IF-2 [Deltaproteobacteria bacterium]
MGAKIRVRDLSLKLGISNRELIGLLRELNVSVKSHMSGLTDAEAQAAEEKFKNRAEKPRVEERKVRPGVIVRHRSRRDARPEKNQDEVQDARTEARPEEDLPVEAAPAAEPARIRHQGARIVVPVASREEKPPAETSPKPEGTAIPDVFVPQVEETAAEAVEHPEVATPDKDVQAQEPPTAPVDGGEPAKTKKKVKKKKDRPAPQVRIISIPDPVEVAPAAKIDEAEADPKVQRGERDAAAKKRKVRKGKRIVDTSKMYHDHRENAIPTLTGQKGIRLGKKGKAGQDQRDAKSKITTQPIKASKRKIRIDEVIRLADLAQQMGIKAQDLIKTLLGMGTMATINQSIDMETAALLASEYGYEVENVGFSEDDYLLPKEEDKTEDLRPRPPVVTIMGHVDHGKTSLLDAIRTSRVTDSEAGGITQHIGAYHVRTKRGEIVFLDTPGHEAFTAMRARGAQVTDLVILVVAADDGVMEQTREAINHSKAAKVPIVVAVNKIDKEGANPERVMRELADHGLVPEAWGGDTIFCEVSAKKLVGIDELLELVLLQAEVLELRANPNKPGRGHIVEARLDKGRGPVATVLIKEGTISQGDPFACGLFSGKVRALFNDQGRKINSAGPSIPVEIQGFEGVPEAGDEFAVLIDERMARKIAESRQSKQREKDLFKESKITLEKFLATKADEEVKNLNLVVKADVQGSLEAVVESLHKLSTDEIKVQVIHGGAGAITESDIMLASASSAIILGFNIRPTAKIKEIADQEKIEIRFYDIIYKLVGEIKDAMSGMLSPEIKEVYLGQAEVRQTFSVPKAGTVAGCAVVDGKLQRNARIRLLRDGVVIYTGKLSSLKRFKDDVKEVTKGFECGCGLENYNDIKVGDIIEAFDQVEEKRTLD